MAQQLCLVIADGDPLIRIHLKKTLVRLGYAVIGEASDGISLITLARKLHPNLVITDVKMPRLDGIQAAKVLTEEHITPVLLLSAYADRVLVDQAREAGVAHYLVKPVRDVELLSAIEIALARDAEFRKMNRQINDLKETLEARKVVERAKGVLIAKYGLTERDSYRKIQRLSMNTRKSMREVAQAILLNEQIAP